MATGPWTKRQIKSIRGLRGRAQAQAGTACEVRQQADGQVTWHTHSVTPSCGHEHPRGHIPNPPPPLFLLLNPCCARRVGHIPPPSGWGNALCPVQQPAGVRGHREKEALRATGGQMQSTQWQLCILLRCLSFHNDKIADILGFPVLGWAGQLFTILWTPSMGGLPGRGETRVSCTVGTPVLGGQEHWLSPVTPPFRPCLHFPPNT